MENNSKYKNICGRVQVMIELEIILGDDKNITELHEIDQSLEHRAKLLTQISFSKMGLGENLTIVDAYPILTSCTEDKMIHIWNADGDFHEIDMSENAE